MTSLLLFLSRMEIIGIKCWPASSDERCSANLQIDYAMLPFTCWLLSVVSYNLRRGRTVATTRLVEQFLAKSLSLSTASDLTSGSLSPKRVT